MTNKLYRIIIHWTAGAYYPTDYEKQCYHYLIDRNGKCHEGKFKPEDNINCQDGKYAAHTGGGNTGSIGVAFCGMGGFTSREKVGFAPISQIQAESLFCFTAGLCCDYNIQVTPENVMTHYEFGLKYPNSTSKGKIDIIYLPPYPNIKQAEIGDFIRQKIKWYVQKIGA